MDNITKGSLNDEEIKAATARLQDLVINNANPTDIDLAQSNLRELIAVRNTYRFTPKDPYFFFDKLFSTGLREDRQKIAEELEDSLIDIILEFQKAPQHVEDAELNYDFFRDLLTFIRLFKGLSSDDAEESSEATISDGQLAWGNRSGLTVQRFCELLTLQKCITAPNARMLGDILEEGTKHPKPPVPINWVGTKNSIVTFFIVSQFLGILNPVKAPARKRPIFTDSIKEDDHLPVPPAAAIIRCNFVINGEKPDLPSISKHHAIPIIRELELIEDRVVGLYESRRMGEKTANNLTWDARRS